MPVGGQPAWQPGGPVALWQAEVNLRLGVLPALRLHPPLNVQGQRLAIWQNAAPVQAEPLAVDAQAQIGIAQGQRRLTEWFQRDLAVAHHQPTYPLQRLEHLLWLGRFLLGTGRQAFHPPLALGIFSDRQLHAAEFQSVQPPCSGPEAARQVRHDSDTVQAHRAVPFTEQHVMRQQTRREALPATFEPAQRDWHAQRRLRFLLHLGAVFGDQGHQLPPQADVERGQNQAERDYPEQLARQCQEEGSEAVHLDALRSSWPLRPGLPLFRATPHRTVPGSTCFPPGT